MERSAIELTMDYFEKKLTYDVRSVEKDSLGWDLSAKHRVAGELVQVEVKGLSGNQIAVELTPNEYKKMKKHKKTYRICVVTNALSNV